MITQNDGPLSMGSILSGRLKKPIDVDKWPSMSLCLSVRAMSVTRHLGLYLFSHDGSDSTFSPVVQGDIALSINIQYNTHFNMLIPV